MKTTLVVEIAVSAFLLALLSACASQVTKPETSAPTATPASQTESGGAQQQNISGSTLATGGAPIDKGSVYYDFDSYVLKSEFKPVVEANAEYLRRHPNANVRIEGNCDERGSTEYNIALGQRRADSVKRTLTLAGVSAARIETVSYGKERPRAMGHDEQSWSQNRRSDFNYTRQ